MRPKKITVSLGGGRVLTEPPKMRPRGYTNPILERQAVAESQKINARTRIPVSKRYVVTAAQSDTPAHGPFLESLLNFCRETGAELVVIPFRYRNPTSLWTKEDDEHDVWDPALAPYLLGTQARLNDNLVILGDLRIQPTVVTPLSGLDGMGHGSSIIVGHPRLQFKSVPTISSTPKVLTTTGAVTGYNYTPTKAGKLASFHHTLGAALVEIQDNKVFHLRQLNADKRDGSFIDLDRLYTIHGSEPAPRASAVVMGDTHVGSTAAHVERARFGDLLPLLKPEHLVWHDLFDGYAVNPHHGDSQLHRMVKHETGRDSAESEVEAAIEYVLSRTPEGCTSTIVCSNHDDFLTRWVLNTPEHKVDPVNLRYYHALKGRVYAGAKMTRGGLRIVPAFVLEAKRLLRKHKAKHVRVLNGQSFQLHGIELSLHGDRGPNGARGSIRNLRRIGVKSVIGHSHSPGIEEGCYQAGTSTELNLEYNRGPSGWLNTDVVVYGNGKRCLVTYIDGRYRI